LKLDQPNDVRAVANQDGTECFVIIMPPELEQENKLTLLDMVFELPTLVEGQPAV
jgi:hypothetical protein